MLALLVALVVVADSAPVVDLVVASVAVEDLAAVAVLAVASEVVEATAVAALAAVLLVALPSTPTLLPPRQTHSQTTLLQAESPATPFTSATYPGQPATRTSSSSSLQLARSNVLRSSTSPMVAPGEPVSSSLPKLQMPRPLLVSSLTLIAFYLLTHM